MFTPQRIHDIQWAFSTKRQANYATPVATLEKFIQVIGVPSIGEFDKTVLSDAQRYGRGFPYATSKRDLFYDTKMSRTMDLTSLMAGWAAAFGLGSISSTQPNVASNPTAYRHVITLLNTVAAGSKQLPITTIGEQISEADNLERTFEVMAVSDFTITGKNRELLQLQINLVGSGKITVGEVTIPALTPVSPLDMGGMIFKVGTMGAPTDISARLEDFSFKFNAGIDLNNRWSPGSGKYASRHWVTVPRPTFDATVTMDQASSDMFDHMVANDILEVSFKAVGDVITVAQPETHDCEIKFPSVTLTTVKMEASGNWVAYKISVADDDIYQVAGSTPANTPIQITVTNTEAAYLETT